MDIAEVQPGMTAELSRTISSEDIEAFARVSHDRNPIHLDDTAAAASTFGRRIAHGFLYGSLISAVIAERCPGPGSIYLSQSMKFSRPVFVGDTVTARVRVLEVDRKRRDVILETTVINQSGTTVIDGTATVRMQS